MVEEVFSEMDVLVLESDPGVARLSIDDLEAAGHRVHRCHEAGIAAFPCVGLASDRCPLETTPVDVVVTVRAHVRTGPTPLEDGLACALRRHLPVVVTGRTALNPYEELGAVDGGGIGIVAACEQAATGTQPAYEARANETLRSVLEHGGEGTASAQASVRRISGRLDVVLHVDPSMSKRTRNVAAVRVTGALRAFDRYVDSIDVSFAENE